MAQDAYVRLRAQITSEQRLPGERLVEADLVADLAVSRAVVRMVLTRLEHEGLVEKEPNRGARVRMVGEQEAMEITEVRAVLEGLAARHAADNATALDIEELFGVLATMTELLEQQDLIGYSDANSRLHAKILDISGHATAQRLVGSLRAQMVRYQYRTILVAGRWRNSLAEHTRLVEAIAAHDGEAAEVAMRAHLGSVGATLARTAGAAPQRIEGSAADTERMTRV